MSNLSPSLTQLKRAVKISELIQKLEAELKAVFSGIGKAAAPIQKVLFSQSAKKTRTISPEARERIAAAQRARWAKIKRFKPVAKSPAVKRKAKRNISPEARAKMAAAAKKRWAKVKEA